MPIPSLKNRVGNAVSGTPGTGTITLAGAETGYQSFATAFGANANVDILIEEGGAWEIARDCTYTHSGTTVTRGTLEASSTGSAVSFTSAAKVYEIETAERIRRHNTLLQGVTPGGRLTLTPGVPVTISDVVGATTVYYTPFVHDVVILWDGAGWVPTTFTEKSLALGTVISVMPYDVFGYLNAGELALEKLVWTSTTARATGVTLQDGRYCKADDKTRLYLGTFCTTSTTTTESSHANRNLYNNYNQTSAKVDYTSRDPGHSWTGVTGWRQYNNDLASKIGYCNGALGVCTLTIYSYSMSSTGSSAQCWIGVNSTTQGYPGTVSTNTVGTLYTRSSATNSIVISDTGLVNINLLERNLSTKQMTYSYGVLRGTVQC